MLLGCWLDFRLKRMKWKNAMHMSRVWDTFTSMKRIIQFTLISFNKLLEHTFVRQETSRNLLELVLFALFPLHLYNLIWKDKSFIKLLKRKVKDKPKNKRTNQHTLNSHPRTNRLIRRRRIIPLPRIHLLRIRHTRLITPIRIRRRITPIPRTTTDIIKGLVGVHCDTAGVCVVGVVPFYCSGGYFCGWTGCVVELLAGVLVRGTLAAFFYSL